MVIGLLVLTAIPTVTGVSEAIAQRHKKHAPKSAAHEERQMQRFNMRAWCAGKSRGKRDVHQGLVYAAEGKLWIQSPTAPSPSHGFPPFEGFYIEYPDPDRVPAELGLVAQVSFDPPLLNWIYVEGNGRICHGNRSESKPHLVGCWGATDDFEEPDEDGPGGLEFEGTEKFVAVEPHTDEDRGRWGIWWDEYDNKLADVKAVEGRLVLRISLERELK